MRSFSRVRSVGAIHVLLVLFIAVIFAGCSSRRQLDRARHLEDAGKYLEAAVIYEQVVAGYHGHPKQQAVLETHIGDILLKAEQPQEAFRAFSKAADLDSSNTLAHLRLAQLYVAANSPDKAYDHLVSVLAQRPNDAEALSVLGAYYSSIGQIERAEQEFQQVLVLEPGRQSTAVALADLYSSAGAVDKAREVLTTAAEANKTEALAWLALGRLEEQQGNGEAAETAYRNAVKAEDVPETNLRLAQHLLRSAKVKEAEEAMSRADGKKPLESTSVADFELNSGHTVRAAIHYLAVLETRLSTRKEHNAQVTAALAARVIEADLDTARQLPPSEGRTALARLHLDTYRANLDRSTAQILAAEIALIDDDVSKATVLANEAVAAAPESAAAYFVLGEVHKTKGDEAEAVSQWNTALGKDPDYTPALLVMAQVEYEHRQYEVAERHVATVVRHEPDNLDALILYARILSGSGDDAAARSIAARAMAIARQSAEPYIVLGQIEMKEHRPALALIKFQQAVVLDSRSKEALEGLTAVYRQGIVKPEMIAKLEHTADAPPRSSALMEVAGRLYGDHHLYNDAARCLKRALEIDRQRATAAMALAENAMAQERDAAFDELESVAGKLGGSAEPLVKGVKAQDDNHPDAAIANYEMAIRRGEHSGVAANNLAWLYAERRQNLDRALELAKFAHDRDPNNAAVMDTLGFVYLARREYSQAARVLKEAMSIGPVADEQTHTSLRQHLMEAYAQIGEPGTVTQ
jgi:tetratricopeptide (TPR) repeat protein